MRRRTPPRRTAKPQPIGPVQTYQVDGLTHEAKGVARLQGKVTFIEGALPGETVNAQVTKAGRRFDEAMLVSLIEPSVHRISPSCEHFSVCGGCRFQHLAGDQQLAAKSAWLQGQFRNLLRHQTIEVLSDASTGYRRRARIAIDVVKGHAVMGFRGKASSDIVPIERCVVLTESLQGAFVSLKANMMGNALAPSVGHIELLEDSKGVSVVFRLTTDISERLENDWQEWADGAGIIIYWQAPKSSKADVALEKMRYYDLGELRLHFHPQDFIQVNAAMNKKMVAQAIDWLNLTRHDVVLDLFCGVGNFTLPLAQHVKSVIGVEVQDTMVQAAKENARVNNIDNASFLAADLTQADAITTSANALLRAGVTKILLDPPRAGALEFLDSIIKIAPTQILYVSCNASTLARDADYLVAKGYHVTRIGLMDMFPQTSHVESMMLLQKKK
ncbi:23S rRNA (uracil(1939)-C(5))-methyltransferase RlmD [Marinomonas sp. IMCC 4694]|uniref:23S rRNA (uracil(1939)-C(5))-methyltransferase RlmD n=1 Tax=Marinomonas sp. IMCC 4694 TaxID=2605432 RepID=UPI0011E74713|nr:23S rRNA (uracil(1939)-C(5))-methyltransferase RlmD [Marinomonas sp. IMCC 4694]TYL47216.1 23S rRNA (uracil(1939)-C(5))-methyltransferase RlmD [Marinomonas sp. IMCC 4694]